jgi:hypothetical protein
MYAATIIFDERCLFFFFDRSFRVHSCFKLFTVAFNHGFRTRYGWSRSSTNARRDQITSKTNQSLQEHVLLNTVIDWMIEAGFSELRLL